MNKYCYEQMPWASVGSGSDSEKAINSDWQITTPRSTIKSIDRQSNRKSQLSFDAYEGVVNELETTCCDGQPNRGDSVPTYPYMKS